jgi:hypothetical protein
MSNFSCVRIGFEEPTSATAVGVESRVCKSGKRGCRPKECRKHRKHQCRYEAPLAYVGIFVGKRQIAFCPLGVDEYEWPERRSTPSLR